MTCIGHHLLTTVVLDVIAHEISTAFDTNGASFDEMVASGLVDREWLYFLQENTKSY